MNTISPTKAVAYFLTDGSIRDKYGDTLFHPLSNVNLMEIYVEDGDPSNVMTINYNPAVKKRWATHWFPVFYRGMVEKKLTGESEPRTFAQYITYMPNILSSMNQNSETSMPVIATLRQQAGNNLIGSYATVADLPTSYGIWDDMQDLEENDVVAYVYDTPITGESSINGFYMVEFDGSDYAWTLQTSGITNYVTAKQYDTWSLLIQAGFGNPAEITEIADVQYRLIWQQINEMSAYIEAIDDDLQNILDGTLPAGKTVADQNGEVIDTTYERLDNKVISLWTPTDEQYPSAKLVSDKLDLKESLINKKTVLSDTHTYYPTVKAVKDYVDDLETNINGELDLKEDK